MAGRAEVDLIEGEEALGVVGHRLDHGEFVRRAARGHGRPEQGGRVAGPVTYEHARIASGLGVDAHDRLAGEVLGGVGDQPVLPDDDHHVLRPEQESVEVRALHPRLPPLERYGRRHIGQCLLGLPVPPRHLVDGAAAAGQEEDGLPVRAVPRQQLLVLGGAVDQYRARRETHARVSGRHRRAC